MFPAPFLFILLILISPFYLIFDGPITYGVIAAAAAVLVIIVALRIRPGEAEFLSSLIRPIAIVAAVPVLVIIIQFIPLRSIGLANPIWQSAADTLSRQVLGSITIDPGATLISLARYFSIVALVFVAAAIGIDRRRANWLLFSLTIAATLAAIMVLAAKLGGVIFLNNQNGVPLAIAATDCAALGIILTTAMALNTIERANAPSSAQDRPVWFRLLFAISLATGAICSLAILTSATSEAYFALASGIATLVVAIIIRRFSLDAWGYSAIVAIALVAAIAVFALRPSDRMMDLTVAFASSPHAPLLALTQRILAETGWLGTGAGTFAVVLPIYGNIDLAPGNVAPTAASAIAIEMGKPFLWATVVAAISLVIVLLRGAARRGRDSVYSMAGASCLVAIIILAFSNNGVLSTSVLVIAAAAVGMAIAQSKSRSV
jgi:hypothetical protein